ncbi:hypothetical protein YTPLAS18_19070 [Nitrospira sp.]|nr:hypothetical protein YTPLAS18_19070 [Nitrospira sp.]
MDRNIGPGGGQTTPNCPADFDFLAMAPYSIQLIDRRVATHSSRTVALISRSRVRNARQKG